MRTASRKAAPNEGIGASQRRKRGVNEARFFHLFGSDLIYLHGAEYKTGLGISRVRESPPGRGIKGWNGVDGGDLGSCC